MTFKTLRFFRAKPVHLSSRTILCALLTLGLSACADDETGANGAQSQAATQHLEQAKTYFAENDLRSARIELRNALQAVPGHLPTLRFMARQSWELGDLAAAEQAAQAAVADPARTALDQLMLVRVLAATGREDQAERQLQEIEDIPDVLQGEKFYVSALIDAGQQEWGRAQVWIRKALASSPDNPDYLLIAVRCAVGLDDQDAQTVAERKLLNVAPDHAEYWLWKGSQLVATEPALAEDAFRKALATMGATDLVTAQRQRGLEGMVAALNGQGREVEAEQFAAMMAPSQFEAQELQSQFQDAAFLLQQGKIDEAAGLLEPLAERFPDHPGVNAMLGAIAYSRGNLEMADERLSASMVAGANPYAAKLLAATKMRLNQPESAGELLQSDILKGVEDADLAAMRGVSALASGSMENAAEELEKALELAPERTQLRLQLAGLKARAEDYDGAVAVLDGMPEGDALAGQVAGLKVALLLRAGKTDAAMSLAAASATKHPADSRAQLVNAVALAGASAFDKAEVAAQRAAELAPDDALPRIYLGAIRTQNNNLAGARSAYLEAAKLDPANVTALRGLFSSTAQMDDESAAVKGMESFATATDQPAAARLLLAQYHLQRKQPTAALAQLDALVGVTDIAPQMVEIVTKARLAAAMAFLNEGQGGKAKEQVGLVLKSDADNLLAHGMALEIAMKVDGPEQTMKMAQALQNSHPQSAIGFEVEADLLARSGEREQAAKGYAKAWKLGPSAGLATKRLSVLTSSNSGALISDLEGWSSNNDPQKLFLLAQAYMQSGNTAEALPRYQKLVDAKIANPVVLNNLAWLYHVEGDPRAESTAREAVALAPESPEILDTLGWVLVEKGNVKEGLPYLEQAVELAPDSAEIAGHLSEARKRSQ